MSREMTIPRKRGETNFARGLTFFGSAITILASFGLYFRVAPIASGVWLLLMVGLLWIHGKGGPLELLVDWIGAVAGRQFVCTTSAESGSRELTFGFELLGHRFVQLQIVGEQITSVEWSSVQASGRRGGDLDDWTVWLRFNPADPASSPQTSIVRGSEPGIWIIGATVRRAETDAFGNRFVQFLLDAGAKLVPSDTPGKFIQDAPRGAEPTTDTPGAAGVILPG